MDLDLTFATPLTIQRDEEITQEMVENLMIRTKLTDDFLNNRISAADFMDCIHYDASINTSNYLDSVEENLNHIVDLYGRPIY